MHTNPNSHLHHHAVIGHRHTLKFPLIVAELGYCPSTDAYTKYKNTWTSEYTKSTKRLTGSPSVGNGSIQPTKFLPWCQIEPLNMPTEAIQPHRFILTSTHEPYHQSPHLGILQEGNAVERTVQKIRIPAQRQVNVRPRSPGTSNPNCSYTSVFLEHERMVRPSDFNDHTNANGSKTHLTDCRLHTTSGKLV